MEKNNVTEKSGDQPRQVMIASTAVAGLVVSINRKNLSLEEAEKNAGATPGCIMEAINTNEMLGGNDYFLLADYFKD